MKYESRNRNILSGYCPAPLEDWYRYNYFNNEIDISGSGVEEYDFSELRKFTGIEIADFDGMKLIDAQTVGSLEVRYLISRLYGDGDPDKVMVTNGSNEALQMAIRSLLKPGDEIVTLGPCYHCHDKIAESIGCKVRRWELALHKKCEIDVDQLQQLLTPKTKAIVLNFPHNPTGKNISQGDLDLILSLLRERDIYLIWDAAFHKLIYDRDPLLDPTLSYHKAISIGSLSKAYGAPGLRFGWMIAPPEVIAASTRQKDFGNLFVAPIIEFISKKVLERQESFCQPRLIQAKFNRDMVDTWIKNHNDVFSWMRPEGGVCGLVKLPNGYDDVDFCNFLLKKMKVLLVPGSVFDMSGYVRLGFGGNTQKLHEGLHRIEMFVKQYICEIE